MADSFRFRVLQPSLPSGATHGSCGVRSDFSWLWQACFQPDGRDVSYFVLFPESSSTSLSYSILLSFLHCPAATCGRLRPHSHDLKKRGVLPRSSGHTYYKTNCPDCQHLSIFETCNVKLNPCKVSRTTPNCRRNRPATISFPPGLSRAQIFDAPLTSKLHAKLAQITSY